MIEKSNTREEWLKKAIPLINERVFNNELEIIPYQISCGWCSKKSALGEVIFPHDGENVSQDDFFPPTIHINVKIKDPVEIIGVLCHECIHCFKNIQSHNKEFKKVALSIGLEKPVTQYHPSEMLIDKCKSIAHDLGEFPGKAVCVHQKEKKERKNKGVLFCPTCGFEVRVKEKMLKEHGFPTCPCGTKMALDLNEDSEAQNN